MNGKGSRQRTFGNQFAGNYERIDWSDRGVKRNRSSADSDPGDDSECACRCGKGLHDRPGRCVLRREACNHPKMGPRRKVIARGTGGKKLEISENNP